MRLRFVSVLLISLSMIGLSRSRAQVPPPASFFGHPLGSQFHRHHEVIDYVEAVAAASSRVQWQPYGQSYEGRPLGLLMISSEDNLAHLELIRQNNLKATGLLPGQVEGLRKPIVWLSYNIHGNESASSEAAMQVLYQLATHDTAAWLDELVVIIDPCVNPDGRDRYVNWYQQVRHAEPVMDRHDIEHQEPWPGGRLNHYLFDLNRDWCWQTQQESQLRGARYAAWMPQVHVDFHEMSPESPYFFAPAAHPYHPIITPWQREFQQLVGSHHARYFDAAGWLYFTSEVYDLFYPSYGDTWPTYQGAMGFTYEQGGSGRAGLALIREGGDTLTLGQRMAHHVATSLSTVEAAYQSRQRLLEGYDQYFADAREGKGADYAAYVISRENATENLAQLWQLLDRQQIRYAQAARSQRVAGRRYDRPGRTSIEVRSGDWVISTAQPQGHLVRVLFDPAAQLEDSLTYDLTAWALPYAYGLEAAAVSTPIATQAAQAAPALEQQILEQPAYAYVVAWEDLRAVRWMADMMQAGFTLRRSQGEWVLRGQRFAPGALVVTRADNRGLDLDAEAVRLAHAHQVSLFAAQSGWAEQGADLGSGAFTVLPAPRVAMLWGEDVNANRLGEIWFCLEREMQYPFHMLPAADLSPGVLNDYDVLILPDGSYHRQESAIFEFVRQGGRVVALEGAIDLFANSSTALGEAVRSSQMTRPGSKPDPKSEAWLAIYGQQGREEASRSVPGSVFAVKLDPTHPLAYGLGESYYALKHRHAAYPYLQGNGWNVGVYPQGKPLSGFAGQQAQAKIDRSLAIGIESLGQGEVVYLVDSPCFRAFWQGGKLLLANALFGYE